MNTTRAPRTRPHDLCGQLGEDDCVDPRDFFSTLDPTERSSARRKSLRKARQLCAQVRRTLEVVLSGECPDPILQGLWVYDVQPAPDASRLLVLVAVRDTDANVTTHELLARLADATPHLRHAVAQAVRRRKTPQLAFHVLPAEAATGGAELTS